MQAQEAQIFTIKKAIVGKIRPLFSNEYKISDSTSYVDDKDFPCISISSDNGTSFEKEAHYNTKCTTEISLDVFLRLGSKGCPKSIDECDLLHEKLLKEIESDRTLGGCVNDVYVSEIKAVSKNESEHLRVLLTDIVVEYYRNP